MQIRGAILALFSASALAAGTIATYTDRSAFLSAAEAIPQLHATMESDSFDGPDNTAGFHGPDVSIPGVSIQDWSNWQGNWPEHNSAVSNGVFNGCEGHFCPPLGLLDVVTTWTFDAPIYAFAADFAYPYINDVDNGLVLCLGPDPCFTFTPSIPYHNGFAGIVSDTPFSQITFTAADRVSDPPDCQSCRITQSFTMDNLVYESSVPEPGTSALLFIGLGFGMAMLAFRSKTNADGERGREQYPSRLARAGGLTARWLRNIVVSHE